jgi:hypothetical protein
MAKHCDEGTVLQAKRFYADIDEAIRTASGRVIQGSNYSYNVLKPTELMDELARSGVKYNPDDVLMVAKTSDGKLMWLETGNVKAGFEHIAEHTDDLLAKGIAINDVPSFIKNQILTQTPINSGRNSVGPFADYIVSGQKYRLAYGDNGFIVNLYPIK